MGEIKTRSLSKNVKIDPQEYILQHGTGNGSKAVKH